MSVNQQRSVTARNTSEMSNTKNYNLPYRKENWKRTTSIVEPELFVAMQIVTKYMVNSEQYMATNKRNLDSNG